LGATAIVTASPLVVALVGGAAGLLAARTGSADITGVRGLGVEARLLAGALLLGTAASVALPGTLSGWGVVVALLGSMARAPTATIVGALALGVAGLTTLGAVANALGGTLSPTLRDSSVLEPFGGHIPDLSRHERAVLLPLALIVLVLGLSPRPLLGAAERASLDLAAFLDPPGPAQIARAFPTAASADIVSPP
jgi:NADH-quinone oxidoreductase subunit M